MDTKNITDLEEGFNDLQQYSDAQFKTIVELQKKIAELESQNNSLKSMLASNLPSLELPTTDLSLGISNEQLICETQMLMLKEAAVMRPLSMEETKKFQIFSEVLEKVKERAPEEAQARIAKVADVELLKIVEGNGSGK